MLCPRCQSACTAATWRSRIRRGDRVIWIDAACWSCSVCRCRFLTTELADQNDSLAATVWTDTFSEVIPPPLPGARIRRLMYTPEGRARVARAFGKVLEQRIQERKP